MSDKKRTLGQTASARARVYRAVTGLENARGDRVEMGETLPPQFVSDEQLTRWVLNGDVTVADDTPANAEDNDGSETR